MTERDVLIDESIKKAAELWDAAVGTQQTVSAKVKAPWIDEVTFSAPDLEAQVMKPVAERIAVRSRPAMTTMGPRGAVKGANKLSQRDIAHWDEVFAEISAAKDSLLVEEE